MLSRRRFLRSSFLSALSMYAYPKVFAGQKLQKAYASRTLPQFANVGQGRKVVILGGGMSGLCAALELEKAGFDVKVLEMTRRAGGRVMTLRNHFGNQYAELGATRIPGTHFLTLEYAREFGLALDEFPHEAADHLYYLEGQKFRNSEILNSGYPDRFAMPAVERKMSPTQIREYYTKKEYERIGNPRSRFWPSREAIKTFDSISLGEAFKGLSGASPHAVAIERSYNGSETDEYNALLWLAQEQEDSKWGRTYAIRAGYDRLPQVFQQKLGSCLILGAKVVRVAESSGGLKIYFSKDGELTELNADTVISTLPIPLMGKIDFEPGLSLEKQCAIQEIKMQSVTRVNLQFHRRFWLQEEKLKGLLVACTDTPIERLWDMTSIQNGQGGILTSYVQHTNADRLNHLGSSSEIIEYTLQQIEKFFPQSKQEFHRGLVWQWAKQPWVEGAWAAFGRNQLGHFRALQEPHGNVFFAGDHTSIYNGWVQGALESAHLAVSEVIEASKK